MSTRFYYGQKDYIVQLNLLDDIASGSASTAAFTSFDARYLGAKTADPTLDNTGAALQQGAMYHNTTTQQTKVYSGSTWGVIGGADSTKEPVIVAGTTGQYWRGDKTWATLNSAAVGLSNVENKTSATIRGEITSANVTSGLGYGPARGAGFATGATNAVAAVDFRSVANPSTQLGYGGGVRFRFGHTDDVATAQGYSDIIDLATYNDSSGGGYNSLYFRKDLQSILHKFAFAGATTWTTKTLAYTDSNITGNAATATKLTTPRTINGVAFDGTANIVVSTAAPAHVQNATRLYATGGTYEYGGTTPYYMAMTYDGTRWRLNASPSTPAAIGVAWADVAASANTANTAGSAVKLVCNDNASTRSANDVLPNTDGGRSIRADFVNAATIGTNGAYAGVVTFAPFAGTTGSTGDASYQLGFGSTAIHGGGVPRLRIRNGIDATWNGFHEVLTSALDRTNYKSLTDSMVVGQLMWKNYGNSHTIFDASAGTSPQGTTVNSSNSASPWEPTFPALMGWNGSSTFGVRVDSARTADLLGSVGATRTLQRRVPYYNNTGPSLNSITNPQMGFAYEGDGNFSGPFIHFGGLASDGDYGGQISMGYSGGAAMRFRTRNDDNASWNAWREVWHNGNLPVSVAPSANSAVIRDASGYITGTYIHMSDDGTYGVPVTALICKKGDNYYRSTDAVAVRAFLGGVLTEPSNNAIGFSGSNLNTLYTGGFYRGLGMVGAPNTGWFWVLVEAHDSSWIKQTATSFGADNVPNETYIRVRSNAAWGAWAQVYTTANPPATSGTKLLAAANITAVADMNFLTLFSSAYDSYTIEVNGATPATNFAGLQFQLAVNGVAISSNYKEIAKSDPAASTGLGTTSAFGASGGIASTGQGVTGKITIQNTNSAKLKHISTETVFDNGSGVHAAFMNIGLCTSASVITGFRLYMSGGNFAAAGTIRVYGHTNVM